MTPNRGSGGICPRILDPEKGGMAGSVAWGVGGMGGAVRGGRLEGREWRGWAVGGREMMERGESGR